MFRSSLFLLLISLVSVESITVKGRLMCNGEPQELRQLFLIDEDTGWLDDEDDELSNVKTDWDGKFTISGYEFEIGGAEYYLSINNYCSTNRILCFHHFDVPGSVQGDDEYDAGDIDLTNTECKMKLKNYRFVVGQWKLVTKEKMLAGNKKNIVKNFRKIISGK